MKLVTGIEWRGGIPLATAVDADEKPCCLAISEIARDGLPKGVRVSMSFNTSLKDWSPIDFSEYAAGFGISCPETYRHGAWAFKNKRTRFIVPALAMVRCFSMMPRLLPMMFKSQSLDDICLFTGRMATGRGGLSWVKLLNTFGQFDLKSKSNVIETLSWLYCFPSARRAWASVYQQSKGGHLNMELPNIDAKMLFRAKTVRGTRYVTGVHLLSLTAHESPYDFASTHPCSVDVSLCSLRSRTNVQLPFHADCLSHEEWERVREIMQSPQRTPRREVLNAVIKREAGAPNWLEYAKEVGVSSAYASLAVRRWRDDGRLGRAFECLLEMRGPR